MLRQTSPVQAGRGCYTAATSGTAEVLDGPEVPRLPEDQPGAWPPTRPTEPLGKSGLGGIPIRRKSWLFCGSDRCAASAISSRRR